MTNPTNFCVRACWNIKIPTNNSSKCKTNTTYKIGQIYWHRKKLWVLVGVLVQTVWAWKYSKGKYVDQKQVNLGFISRVFVKITWWVCLEFFSGDVIFGKFNFCHSCGLKTIWQTKVQKYLLTSIFPQKKLIHFTVVKSARCRNHSLVENTVCQ